MNIKTPNLFDYATSELSQDAFITWLINWSSPSLSNQDSDLNKLSIKFVQSLLDIKTDFSIKSINCSRQLHNIDIWALVNEEYFLVIEDKKATKEHSNQLERYKLIAQDICKNTKTSIKLVYFKMEEQGNYENVISNGYRIFNRKKMLNVLDEYVQNATAKNNIVMDFHNYILNLEHEIKSYITAPFKDWSHYSWKGFFSLLSEVFPNSDWNYVSNPSGGFMGFWWNNYNFKIEELVFNCYLQLEQEKLVIKIHPSKRENANKIRHFVREKLQPILRDYNLSFKNYGRIGNYMGILILDTDYRIMNESNMINIESTLKTLKLTSKALDTLYENVTAHNNAYKK